MRTAIISILTILCLALGATGESPTPVLEAPDEEAAPLGQLLTVTVEGAPQGTTSATVDLCANVRGLQLRRDADGAWVGAYAVLPEMMAETMRPKVVLLDARGSQLPVEPGDGTSVSMACSEFDGHSLASVINDDRAAFVFDENIASASIKVWAGKQAVPISPMTGQSCFTIPAEVDAQTLTAITALSLGGEEIVFSPGSTDTAIVEQDL